MANLKISELTETTTAPDESFIPIDDGEITKRISVLNFNTTSTLSAQAAATTATNAASTASAAATTATTKATDAETARTQAVTAKTAAEAAQGYAEAAQSAAESASSAAVAAKNSIVSAANTAMQKATEATNAATEASTNKALAKSFAESAEAYGAGTVNGTPVASGTDQYHNNAPYYAGEAATSASAASGSASSASDSATLAQSYAKGDTSSRTGETTDNAKYYSEQAASAASAAAISAENAATYTAKAPYIGDNGKWYVWDATNNQYVNTNVDATGPTGNGIVSTTKTSTSGKVDTYTILYTNGDTDTFTVTNGEDGQGSGDMLKTDYDHDSDVFNAGGIPAYVTSAISNKADKVSSPTNGNFAGLDSNGNLTDSGSKASDFLTSHQDISGKMDKSNPTGTGALSINRKANTTIGDYSVAAGIDCTASGDYSVAIGSKVSATADGAHAEGYTSATLANYGTLTASGMGSHAEGYAAVYNGSIVASGSGAHIEGMADVDRSHIASGDGSHVEGHGNTGNAYYCHVEGEYNTANSQAYASHVGGRRNVSSYDSQTIIGKYNSNKSTTLFEVGNGSSDNARSNALEVYSDGYISQNDGTDKYKFAKSGGLDGFYDGSGNFHALVNLYLEQSVTLSTSADTTVTFTNASILATSRIDPYSSDYTIAPSNVVAANGSCTVTFKKASTASTITVGIEVKN